MPKYIVSVLVKYQVEADHEDHANEIVVNGVEFPLMPYDDNNFSISDEVVGIAEVEEA